MFNKAFAVLMGMFAVISLVANPVVFYYNTTQRQSIATRLFQMLAVADFLTNSTYPFVIMASLLDSQVKPIKDISTFRKVNQKILLLLQLFHIQSNSKQRQNSFNFIASCWLNLTTTKYN